jgi:hypothetical protein
LDAFENNNRWKITLTPPLKKNIGSKQRENVSWQLGLLRYPSTKFHKRRKGKELVGRNSSPKERKQHKKRMKK